MTWHLDLTKGYQEGNEDRRDAEKMTDGQRKSEVRCVRYTSLTSHGEAQTLGSVTTDSAVS